MKRYKKTTIIILATAIIFAPNSSFALRPSAFKLVADRKGPPEGLHLFKSSSARHRYNFVEGVPKGLLLNKVISQTSAGLSDYLKRFYKGVKSKRRFLNILFKDPKNLNSLDFFDVPTIAEEKIAPLGILRDERRVLWVARKPSLTAFGEDTGEYNIKELEMFTSLLFKGRANSAQIRFFSRDEVEGTFNFPFDEDDIEKYYLRRVATKENMPKGILVHEDPSEAFSALIAGNVLIRKADPHFMNLCFVEKVPVSIDNGYALLYNKDSYPGEGFKKFLILYVYHNLFQTAGDLIDERQRNFHGMYAFKKFIRIFRYLGFTLNEGIKDPVGSFEKIITARRNFGLGDGFMAAEMLDIEHLRKSILQFKRIENVRELAIESGYLGEGLEYVVNFIKANQRTLGRDVNELLKALTGKDYGIDKMDEIEKKKEPVLYTDELLDSYRRDIERLKDIQRYGWNYLSKDAIYVLLNPDRAEWMVNFSPMTYYEVRTFMMREDAAEFCDKHKELYGFFDLKQPEKIFNERRPFIEYIIQKMAIRKAGLRVEEVEKLFDYIWLPNVYSNERLDRQAEIVKSIDEIPQEVKKYYDAIYRIGLEVILSYGERDGWSESGKFGFGDEHELWAGTDGSILEKYIEGYKLTFLSFYQHSGVGVFKLLNGLPQEAVSQFKDAFLNDVAYELRRLGYDNIPHEKFNKKTVLLIKDELMRLHASGIPGVKEVIEGLNIDELNGILSNSSKDRQADMPAQRLEVPGSRIEVAISAAA